MNPQLPPTPPTGDETVHSSPARGPLHESGEATDASGAADATIVRGAPSAPTVDEMAAPNNFGRYELLGEIARGGMGVVYKARQHGLDRTVALKMILGTGTSTEAAQRFLLEARAAAALDHPNVVPIYDTGENAGRPYFTMALVDGPNLRGYADARGVLPISAVVSLFAQVVAGVAHAHAAGIIHRDLKPANVLIDKDGRPRVTDFGLAKRATTDSHLTVTGQVVGTPSYMAPEQARDSKDVGPPADVYALGAILYFLLTGRPPFVGDSFTDLLIKVVSDTPAPPRQLRPDVSAEIESLCLRCLAKAPGERFADAQALAEALAPIADRYVSSSGGLTPSLARIGLTRASTPSIGTMPDLSAPSAASGSAQTNSVTAQLPQARPPAQAAPAASRLPLFAGLGVAAVLLVGAIGYLATRGDKKHDDAANAEPPPVIAAPETHVTLPQLPPGPAVTGKFAWPAPAQADFGLKVEMVAPAAKKDAEGIVRMAAGVPMTIHMTAERDCRVSVWVLDPTGHELRLFPNDDEPDDQLKAGKERVVPGGVAYTLETTATEGVGADRLRVIATTGEPIKFPPGAKTGRYTAYSSDAERERLASTVRGIVIKKVDAGPRAAVSEAEIPFFVK